MTSIGDSAFSGCSRLTSVTIPYNIGLMAFNDCSKLTSVTLHDGVRSIGDGVFRGRTGLTSVTIPNSVTNICEYAFYGCSGLTSVTIPDGVTSIGNEAFSGCSSLIRVTIPDSVTSIADSAFSGCSRLTSITIPSRVTSIGNEAFSGCHNLTSVTIPDGVTNIGNEAFSDCSSLTSVMIPDGVTSIGDSTFSGCSGLTSVTIPGSVTNIASSAFSGCSRLTSVTIPDSVTSIGGSAFSGCSGLTSVTIPDSVTSMGDSAFRDCTGLTSVTIPYNIGLWAFNDCSNLTSVTLHDGVRSIDDGVFRGRAGLMSVTIPNSVTNIGESAFYGCSGLTSVTIPDEVTSIGNEAFSGCSSLTSVTIPDGMTSIGNEAFYNCSSLTSVTIPDSVTSIGSSAFVGTAFWTALLNDSAEGIVMHDDWVLGVKGTCQSNVVLPPGTRGIVGGTFSGQSNLMRISIPGSVKNISDGEFSGCEHLVSVKLEDGVEYIGDNAFLGAQIVEVTIPGSVTNVGAKAFSSCTPLTSVRLMPGVRNVRRDSFENCPSLATLTIPSDLAEEATEWFLSAIVNIVIDDTDPTDPDPTDPEPTDPEIDPTPEVGGVTAPVISSDGGMEFFGESCIVTLECATDGAAIYYSTNGVTPKASAKNLYTAPFTITQTTRVIAVAVKDGEKSEYADATITRISLTLSEAVGAETLVFTTGGDAPWTPLLDENLAFSGRAAAQSGSVGDNGETWMETVVSGAGTFSFRWKVSCEMDDYGLASWDHLKVETNGVEIARIDGETDWEQMTLQFENGENTVRWTYVKDESDFGGEDCAWIDDVAWVGEQVTTVDLSECAGARVKVNGVGLRIMNGGFDITPFLDIPAGDEDGYVDLGMLRVKGEIVKEALDAKKGAEFGIVDGEPVLMTAPTRPGLVYTLREGATLDGMVNGDSKVGDGNAWRPNITVKGGSSGFYSIGVGIGR